MFVSLKCFESLLKIKKKWKSYKKSYKFYVFGVFFYDFYFVGAYRGERAKTKVCSEWP